MVANTWPLIAAGPVSTNSTPSRPTETVRLPDAPANMYTLPRTCRTWMSEAGCAAATPRNSDASIATLRPHPKARLRPRVHMVSIALTILHQLGGGALQLLAIFRVHRLGSAARRLSWHAVAVGKLIQRRVGPRQHVRHHALRTLDLSHRVARIRRNVLVHVQLVIGAADERLGEINRIVHDSDHG